MGVNFTNGLASPEINKGSGEIIYLDNRPLISRNTRQKEDIKIIIDDVINYNQDNKDISNNNDLDLDLGATTTTTTTTTSSKSTTTTTTTTTSTGINTDNHNMKLSMLKQMIFQNIK